MVLKAGHNKKKENPWYSIAWMGGEKKEEGGGGRKGDDGGNNGSGTRREELGKKHLKKRVVGNARWSVRSMSVR